MTVEEYLRAPFNELSIHPNTVKAAALSPARLRNPSFRAVRLEECYEDLFDDPVSMNSVEYALSTLYYSMSSTVTGGSKSEKRGNRQISVGGYALTTRDREAFRAEADAIRERLGLEPMKPVVNTARAFDASRLRNGLNLHKLKL
ncbi:MAG: hypothetical protein HDS14_00485 [Bacteroides sp.]|nr:hypothetical protein [Bacteroides sp.]